MVLGDSFAGSVSFKPSPVLSIGSSLWRSKLDLVSGVLN